MNDRGKEIGMEVIKGKWVLKLILGNKTKQKGMERMRMKIN